MTQVTLTPAGPAGPQTATDFPKPPKTRPSRVLLGLMFVLLLIAGIWSMNELNINIATLVLGWDNALGFFERVFPLTLPEFPELMKMIGQTLAIVVLATVVGFLLSVPMALLAAHNTTPHPTVRMLARFGIVIIRAVPDFIIAIFFVRVFGLGALPGILALGVGSVGMMAKLYADAIEEVDQGPIEALRASGAGKLQQIVSGVIPQVKPQLIATALHAFDINLRGSVLLGFVGVTGIGMYISVALETMNYGRGIGLTAVLLVLALGAELISNLIRRSLLGGYDNSQKKNRWLEIFMVRLTERGWVRKQQHSQEQLDTPANERTMRKQPWTADRVKEKFWTIAMFVVIGVSLLGSGIEFTQLEGGLKKGFETIMLYFPPETAGIFDKLFASMVETVQMGLAGTLVGLVIALPFGLLSARNVVNNPRINAIARGLVVTIRAIPGIIIGITFVVLTGLGATAGALALSVGAIGFFGKIIADSLEEVDVRVQDAVRTTGATNTQVFFASTLRQVSPALAAHTMHQLDSNLRGATSMGVIGAGGIGFYMTNASRVLEYGVVTTSLILVIATVIISESLAIWTRKEVQ